MREDLQVLRKLGRWPAVWVDIRRELGLQEAFRVLEHWKARLKEDGPQRQEYLASIKALLLGILDEYLYHRGNLHQLVPPPLAVVPPKQAPFSQQNRFRAFWYYQESAHDRPGGLVRQLHRLQQHWYDLQSPGEREQNLKLWRELYLELLERFFTVEQFCCEPTDLPLDKELWLSCVLAELNLFSAQHKTKSKSPLRPKAALAKKQSKYAKEARI